MPSTRLTLSLIGILVLTACSSGRYAQRNDSFPEYVPDNMATGDAPVEYVSSVVTLPYTVFGRRYVPMTDASHYDKRGLASWYGQKFHGHLTANGEVYDMYQMSAAHKTLPLPSFVRVTNMANGRQVIVRVNDRGPFHGDRVIDLSYAAAYKLDMLKTGTAKVRVQALKVREDGRYVIAGEPVSPDTAPPIAVAAVPALTPSAPVEPATPVAATALQGSDTPVNPSLPTSTAAEPTEGWQIQVASHTDASALEEHKQVLSILLNVPASIVSAEGRARLMLGPIASESAAASLLEQVRQKGFADAFRLLPKAMINTNTGLGGTND